MEKAGSRVVRLQILNPAFHPRFGVAFRSERLSSFILQVSFFHHSEFPGVLRAGPHVREEGDGQLAKHLDPPTSSLNDEQ